MHLHRGQRLETCIRKLKQTPSIYVVQDVTSNDRWLKVYPSSNRALQFMIVRGYEYDDHRGGCPLEV